MLIIALLFLIGSSNTTECAVSHGPSGRPASWFTFLAMILVMETNMKLDSKRSKLMSINSLPTLPSMERKVKSYGDQI